VDGFREDVINFISKREDLPNGLPFLPAVNGLPYYKDGPHIYEYMEEFREVCKEYDCFQLGEGPLTTVKSALRYLTGPKKTLDMMFSFDHMMADCIYTEYVHRPFSLIKLKKAFTKWQNALNGRAWNALYLENHDHPRVISRYGSEKFWRASGTMLAVSYLFQQGTPFVYQGQEIGMTNIRLRSIDQYVDVSSLTNFNRYHLKDSIEKRLERIWHSSRDSSRTPMQWTSGKNAGFSEAEPWFYVNPNYESVNVEAEEDDPYSILNFYRKCLQLRKSSNVLLWGSYREFYPRDPHIYMYERRLCDVRCLIICSFAERPIRVKLPKEYVGLKRNLILCNYPKQRHAAGRIDGLPEGEQGWFRPYEARVYRIS
jgi:oligo-1,6-glucosidase